MANEHQNDRTAERVEPQFADVAENLDLRLEQTSFAAGENRPTGARARFRVFDVDTLKLPPQTSDHDRKDIESIIGVWESLHPDDIPANWKNYASDPYATIGTDSVIVVSDDTIQQWFESKEFNDGLLDFPISNPRKVTVSDINIVFLGRSRAAATYRVEEEHTNGRVSAGNSASILIKTEGGWRIAMTAAHPNFTDDLAPGRRPDTK